MIKCLNFFFILFLPLLGHASSNICEHGDSRNSILSPLAEESLGKWCATSICYKNNEKINRKKCINQSVNYLEDRPKTSPEGTEYYELRKNPILVENNFRISIEETLPTSPETFQWLNNAFILKTGDQCYNECRPENTRKLLSKKTTDGIYQEDCRQCLLKLNPHNKSFSKLVKGQKCYPDCKRDSFSSHCQQCMKNQVNAIHILTADNKCYEAFDSEWKRAYETSMSSCDSAKKLYRTRYFKQSKFSVDVFLKGNEPECIEIDNYKAQHFKRSVPMSYCEQADSVNNSDRHVTNKDSNHSVSPKKSKSAKGNKQ